MTWNFDISSAPRGQSITFIRPTMTKDGMQDQPHEQYQHERVWLWTKCGKKMLTRWLPETRFGAGRWEGLATREEPIAWHQFDIPDDPAPFPVSSCTGLGSIILEDAGSGQ